MVRAVLDGRKTQTRRPFPVQPHGEYGEHYNGKMEGPEMYEPQMFDKYGDAYPGKPIFGCYTEDGEQGFKCPFGQPGDRLWVRETLSKEKWPDYHYDVYPQVTAGTGDEDFNYRGSDYRGLVPAIHMPRWASRILLEITDIRVERVQDISEADAAAEGCNNSQSEAAKNVGWYEKPRRAFRRVWEQVYGDSWNRNDWVWVIEFKAVEIKQ